MGIKVNEPAAAVAEAFVTARRQGRALPAYPGERPSDLVGAYAIQDHALAIDGRAVAGWKVGRINPPEDARLGANRLAGPIFVDSVVDAAQEVQPAMPVFAGGFAAAEAEILLHVAPGFNGSVPNDDAGTRAVIDEVRIGIEIASSPYPGINEDGPAVTASDFGNNHGQVVGPVLSGWQDADLCAIPIVMEIDGAEVGRGTAATMLDGPYGAVRFLLANLASREIDTSGGLWVSSGAITGVHPVNVGSSVRATFGSHGTVNCTIAAAQSRTDG
jgi:2-keto-4-pentenoate hydratase